MTSRKRKPTKPQWLSRDAGASLPHLILVFNQEEFDAVMRRLKVKSGEAWVCEHADATTHCLESGPHQAVVVGLREPDKADSIDIASLLVHESVHVWHAYLRGLAENAPGEEIEAYGIQGIAETLMREYARRKGLPAPRG